MAIQSNINQSKLKEIKVNEKNNYLKKEDSESKTFPVPFPLGEIKENISIFTYIPQKLSKEKIINQALRSHSQGYIKLAAKYYKNIIDLGFNDPVVFTNYGVIIKGFGYLKEAEGLYRKAIEVKPDYENAHFNLGNLLRDLGNIEEAEKAYLTAIKIKSDFAKAYYSISMIKSSYNNKTLQYKLFSKQILNNISDKEKVDIYFARSNFLHNQGNYIESSRYLKLANDIKLKLNTSNIENLIKKSKLLLNESMNKKFNLKIDKKSPECIFIVGMPRSGSTLLESILSINSNVDDFGEINIFEESFLEERNNNQRFTLSEIYWDKVKEYRKSFQIITNKWLYNYQYAGIICTQIPNAKIIHCYRNPLDNILSIYRANFDKGNEYASSIVDCANAYLDQERIMEEYKIKYRSKIYDFNYDKLVNNSHQEIKSLINWLGWEWNDSYLYPHLNSRAVFTASCVQVRSPISSSSVDGWRNYKYILQPAYNILKMTHKYKKLK